METLLAAAEKAAWPILSIGITEAILAGRLDPHHHDPFDRMIVSQALVRDYDIISGDAMLDRYGIRRIW